MNYIVKKALKIVWTKDNNSIILCFIKYVDINTKITRYFFKVLQESRYLKKKKEFINEKYKIYILEILQYNTEF